MGIVYNAYYKSRWEFQSVWARKISLRWPTVTLTRPSDQMIYQIRFYISMICELSSPLCWPRWWDWKKLLQNINVGWEHGLAQGTTIMFTIGPANVRSNSTVITFTGCHWHHLIIISKATKCLKTCPLVSAT